ncbi:MAG: N-acetylneuraminate synthase [Planctomycetes bacterium]|nr:N-acetylneuraminate synthase [Planctomycetota bacterium]
MSNTLSINGRPIGDGHPVFIIAEIGINHNGDLDVATRLIDAAMLSGCDAVKFQKRTPELCVPPEQRDVIRETPWGMMTYLDYRRRVEFDRRQYEHIDRYCRSKGMTWFASPWDEPSVDFLEALDPPCYKVASASLTDDALLRRIAATGRPVILSTGMSTMEQIGRAVSLLDGDRLALMHTTSTYPCKAEEINLSVMSALREAFPACPVGYSGHEVGLQITLAAAAMGAALIERHVTLDRAMWGSDQAASVEPMGLMRLVRDIRIIETARGDGTKRIYDSEKPIMERLRRRNGAAEVTCKV